MDVPINFQPPLTIPQAIIAIPRALKKHSKANLTQLSKAVTKQTNREINRDVLEKALNHLIGNGTVEKLPNGSIRLMKK